MFLVPVGKVELGNPCYHTFNAEQPVAGMSSGIGITEKAGLHHGFFRAVHSVGVSGFRVLRVFVV